MSAKQISGDANGLILRSGAKRHVELGKVLIELGPTKVASVIISGLEPYSIIVFSRSRRKSPMV